MLASPVLQHTARDPKERNIISVRRCRCEVSSFYLIFVKVWTGSIDFNLKKPKQNLTKIRPVGVLCISLICVKSVTNQNLAFLSYWYRKKRSQMHF